MQVSSREHRMVKTEDGVVGPQIKSCRHCLGCKQYFPQLKLGPFIKHQSHCKSNISQRDVSCSPLGRYANHPSVKIQTPLFAKASGQTDQAHLPIHKGKKSHECSQCGRCFARKGNLRTHQRVHTGEKPYQCRKCNKCFSQQSSLARHRHIHTGEKPYGCSQCNKYFVQKSGLIDHLPVHTGIKPFVCMQCNKRFALKCRLIKH